MCGISGIFHFNNSRTVSESNVVKMRDELIHRGPDDAGFFISPSKKVGLGTRRLKIIDLSAAGHMPMGASRPNSKPNVWITYNGEVYNFKKLRVELEKKGYRFHSQTDTEVVLNSYLEYGFDCVKRFNGMFAFVIWDDEKKTVFAARDHIGIKPFYYAVKDGTFYFGSEIKAILAHPDFKKELEETGISHYLTFSSLPAPHTLFKGVKKLAPAHYLTIREGGEIKEEEYWNPVAISGVTKNEEAYVDEIRYLLKESIQSQMVSDVPFGCFLSGGIDSSTNAALMSEALGKPVETFSVGSGEFDKYNEFKYSRKVAGLLNANTHEISITENHLEEFLSRYAYYADDPNGDQVCLPLFWLAKLAKDNNTIMVQVGEGADELFAGYPVYLRAVKLYHSWWRWLEKLPKLTKKFLLNTSSLLHNPRFEFHKEYLNRLAKHQEPFWGYAIAFSDYQKDRLLSPKFKSRTSHSSAYPIVKQFYDEIESLDSEADFLKRLTYLEIKNRLAEVLLMRTDKMVMAHSIEGRVPFLDRRLVELAFQIPSNLKFKDGTLKYMLKKAVEGLIPQEIIDRKKQGFATPMREWLKPESSASPYLLNTIRNSKLKERGFFDYNYIEKLIRAHQKGQVDNNFRIWNLVTLSLWYDYWFK